MPANKLRTAALVLAMMEVVCFLLPWARVRMPASQLFGPSSSSSAGPYAELGLLGCVGGDLCKAFNSVQKDKGVPQWLKSSIGDDLRDSSFYTASICASLALVASLICIAYTEYIRAFRSPSLPGADTTILFLLAASSLALLSAVLYVAILHSSLHGGEFLLGVYAASIAGATGLCFLTSLFAAEPIEHSGRGVVQGSHFMDKANYGTAPRTVL